MWHMHCLISIKHSILDTLSTDLLFDKVNCAPKYKLDPVSEHGYTSDHNMLNIMIEDQCKKLEVCLNVQSNMRTSEEELNRMGYKISKIAIVHFSGGGDCKPWAYHSNADLKEVYFKYYKMTPWRISIGSLLLNR